MVLFLLDQFKYREFFQFLFHFITALPKDDAVNRLHRLFVGIAPIEPLPDT